MEGRFELKNESELKVNNWLNGYAKNITSQNGEDGILEKVLEIIGDLDKWCVEFGSWDGKTASNTYNLIQNKDYSAVLIECDKERFAQLVSNCGGNDKIICLNKFVGFDKENCLDTILQSTPVTLNFDLLSIDIDGNDYHVFNAMRLYRPKVIVIEINPTIPACVEFVQPCNKTVTQGTSILSMTKLAKSKGYELVAATSANAIYVDSKYFELFGIKDNSVSEIWTDRSAITHIFCGFDGTVFLAGCKKLPWQNIDFRESKVQQLPKWARKRIGDKSVIRAKLGKFYRRYLKKKTISR